MGGLTQWELAKSILKFIQRPESYLYNLLKDIHKKIIPALDIKPSSSLKLNNLLFNES